MRRALLLASLAVIAAADLSAPPQSLFLELVSDGDEVVGEIVQYRGAVYRATRDSQSRSLEAVEAEAEQPPCAEAEDDQLAPGTPEFYADLAIVVVLIIIAALMAGCQMGFMSIDSTTLRLKEEEGTPEEKRAAKAVSGVLHNRHHLLVALLLCNAAANEALPIFLDKLVPSAYAILVSVTCVLIFGEILPSAVMLGPRQLFLSAALAPGVRFLMVLTSPISVPIAKVLDSALGSHDGVTGFKRNEFKALVRLQARAKGWQRRASVAATPASAPPPKPLERTRTPAEMRKQLSGVLLRNRSEREGASPDKGGEAGGESSAAGKAKRGSLLGALGLGGRLPKEEAAVKGGGAAPYPPPAPVEAEDRTAEFSDDEVTILSSVFSLQSKRVIHLMNERNTWDHARMIRHDGHMDMTTMQLISQWGNSRVPVFRTERNNVRGILLVKEHLALDPEDAVPIASLKLRYPVLMHPDVSSFDALNIFQTGQSHMALITPHGAEIVQAWQSGADVPSHVRILGVCTIEDVIEELIGEEILDDTDQPLTPEEKLAGIAATPNAVWNRKGIFTMATTQAAEPPGQLAPRAPSQIAEEPMTEAAMAAGAKSSDPLLGGDQQV